MTHKSNKFGKNLPGLVLIVALALTACGNKEKKPGQVLASVDGAEITVSQLNEELQRAGVQPAQQEAARKQLLESIIDRQLLQNAASKDGTDRDPKVVQAIERAKALIVAQAYLQKRIGTIAKPTKEEITDYFNKHPEFFSNRKQFDMKELVISTAAMNDQLKSAMDSAKSLEEVANWLDAHSVKFARTQLSRSSADLPPELTSKLLSMPKGQLFIIREGERSLLISIADVRDAPVDLEAAAQQIGQFLLNQKTKSASDAEVARLRSAAKIELSNQSAKAAEATPLASKPVAPPVTPDANERGAAGLR